LVELNGAADFGWCHPLVAELDAVISEQAQYCALAQVIGDHQLGGRSAGLVVGDELPDGVGARRRWIAWTATGTVNWANHPGSGNCSTAAGMAIAWR
jgi:hypothetical protein